MMEPQLIISLSQNKNINKVDFKVCTIKPLRPQLIAYPNKLEFCHGQSL